MVKTAVVLALLLGAALAAPPPLPAIVINFESLADLESVTTQFPGITFSNATVLTAGISLNEFEFPPKSGVNVAFDDGGPITIAFASPVSVVSAAVTYLTPVTLTGYDSSLNPVAIDTSDFTSNTALSGDPGSSPNELMFVKSAAGFSKVTFAGDFFGGSLTIDDVTVPVPATLLLVAVGVAGALSWKGMCRRGAARRS